MSNTMEINSKVIINNTNSVWDGKDGILKEIIEDQQIGVVYVNFIPEENKKIIQNFPLENIFPLEGNINIPNE